MDFITATDQLIGRVSLDEIALECGVSVNSIQRARMQGVAARTPPRGWQKAIAALARRRGAELVELADILESERGD